MFIEVNGVGGAPLILIFLAAMSSSRSDVVTQSDCSFLFPFVRTLFFLLVSLKFLLVLKSFNGVSRKIEGCLREFPVGSKGI